MLYEITDGTLSVGGQTVLSHVNFEIRGTEKIAVVGSNGAGKTTLLRLIAGELALDADDRRMGPGITGDRKVTVGMLRQQAFAGADHTVGEELLRFCPAKDMYDRERYAWEMECDRLFTGFGFAKEDKGRRLSGFSGGEQTKIALIGLLLRRPDILLLDEPTNHLDIRTVEWLERYLQTYDRAVVMVSHDRFFLDETAQVVYELESGRLTRYSGNYTRYREQKQKNERLQRKAYDQYMEEKERLEQLIERFKHKPKKAAFARAKKKALERLPKAEKPAADEARLFTGNMEPLILGSRQVLECEKLQIGYREALRTVTLRVRRGQKIGILGENGSGKTAFLKTAAGLLPPVKGSCTLGNNTTIGYFDQQTAALDSEKQVAEHFHALFPSLTEKEVRSILGAYLFGGREAGKRVGTLSGGEKARLVLAELLESRPNLLLLDEPTNHMDVRAKERLEAAFASYTGTMLFVSHDRYFLANLADALLIFEGEEVYYYPFGYRHYTEHVTRRTDGADQSARIRAEEQALIDGMRAVPRPERHRLREIPTEEAYADWRLRLAAERLEETGRRYERLWEEACGRREAWETSEAFWRAACWRLETEAGPKNGTEAGRRGEHGAGRGGGKAAGEGAAEEAREAAKRAEAAREAWQEACLQWYEAYEERHSESSCNFGLL